MMSLLLKNNIWFIEDSEELSTARLVRLLFFAKRSLKHIGCEVVKSIKDCYANGQRSSY